MLGSVDFLPGGGAEATNDDSTQVGETNSPFKLSSFESTMEKVMIAKSAQANTGMEKKNEHGYFGHEGKQN